MPELDPLPPHTFCAKDLRTGVVHYVDGEADEVVDVWGTTFCGIRCIPRDWRNTSQRVMCLRCIALEES